MAESKPCSAPRRLPPSAQLVSWITCRRCLRCIFLVRSSIVTVALWARFATLCVGAGRRILVWVPYDLVHAPVSRAVDVALEEPSSSEPQWRSQIGWGVRALNRCGGRTFNADAEPRRGGLVCAYIFTMGDGFCISVKEESDGMDPHLGISRYYSSPDRCFSA